MGRVENQTVQGHQGSIVSCGHSWRRRGRIELSRAPAENGKYVVLDYVKDPHTLPDGTTIALYDRNGQLDLEVDTSNTTGGGDGALISDSWTALACDTDHALRLHRDENGKIYIQQGEWIVTSKIYSPIN